MQKRFQNFTCLNCGAKVKPLENGTRDHCPQCLYSQHVDNKPGDRSNQCMGLMEPIGVKKAGSNTKIEYKCLKCGQKHWNKLAPDDNWQKVIEISSFK